MKLSMVDKWYREYNLWLQICRNGGDSKEKAEDTARTVATAMCEGLVPAEFLPKLN